MISKLRFSLMTVIMLVLLGFGFQNQAIGQVGLDGLFCPGIPDTTGWLEIERSDPNPLLTDPTVSVGLVGTVESHLGSLVGGIDFQYVDDTNCDANGGKFRTCSPTIETGSQLITWWTQKDGRNTYLQVTNEGGGFDGPFVNVHVRIYNESCVEIRDFCDSYSHDDTHEYNFGDLFANTGANIGEGNLQGVEGWLVVTAVKECGTDEEQAIEFDHFAGQLIVHDSDDYLYGTNVYARQSICFDETDVITGVNQVQNGSFQNGPANWTQEDGFTAITQNGAFNPPAAIPVNPYNSPFAAFVLSANNQNPSGNQYFG
ncbi:MAG: hypothetical protein IH875_08165, partial [Candidatus Dadabacteria bacterium]|nr:hypothetical protein [Candidatus Dadabacteria bacterium]